MNANNGPYEICAMILTKIIIALQITSLCEYDLACNVTDRIQGLDPETTQQAVITLVNPYDAKANFVQSTRMQRSLKII